MTPDQYVQDKAAASGSSFYYAFRFLPADKRAAITAFYAFCREVDDVVDDIREPTVAAAKLAWWAQEVRAAHDGRASHPVMQAWVPHARRLAIGPEPLLQVIAGCDMDLQQNRYLDWPALQRYSHLVAGVVGEVAARIFGQTQPQTTAYAHTLGQALQLTNILRDVGEDARRGRVYLPLDDLKRHGVTVADILARRDSPAFRALMAFEAQRAHALYDQALSLLPQADWRAQKPGLMMAAIYRALLRALASADYAVLHQRVALTPLRKLWLAWQVQALGRLPR